MKNKIIILFITIIFIFMLFSPVLSSEGANETMNLKINPLNLVSLKECYNITSQLKSDIFPDWDLHKTPVLFYKPNIQDILINFPHKPEGFSEYTGFIPLEIGCVYVRNNKTLYTIDDQNTSARIDEIPVLVVSDPASSLRNQLIHILKDRPKDFAINWTENWGFEHDPYSLLFLILHEGFHAHQNVMAPDKDFNSQSIIKYPLFDPVNNSLFVLEGNILKDALLSKNSEIFLKKVKQFVAVRTLRQSRLEREIVEYENLVEYSEGLARYIELKFLQIGEKVTPTREMYYHNGFNGYKGILYKKYEHEISDIVNIIGVNDNRFANKFCSAPFQWRLYASGAVHGLLLDETVPEWKKKIFDKGVYLDDLLKEYAGLSDVELQKYLDDAKMEYQYEKVYEDKLQFKSEADRYIKEKTTSIINTNETLVKIIYKDAIKKLSYTVFGVTPVTSGITLYEMVPIKITFNEYTSLHFKQAIPVLVDTDKKEIIFAVNKPVSEFKLDTEKKLNTEEFVLSVPEMDVNQNGNMITIYLKD